MARSYKKMSARRAAPRRRTGGSTVKKPYGGSKYGNDAFVKVEKLAPLSVTALGEVFSTMRVVKNPTGGPSQAPGNSYLGDQEEFKSFQNLYARYEVKGMKAEVTLNARNTFTTANIGGGLAPSVPAVAIFPPEQNNVAYPLQKDCNVQGEVTTLYYSFSKDLRNSGAKYALATTEYFTNEDQGIVQFRGVVDTSIPITTVVGSIKFTWYVRFHGRTRKSQAGINIDPRVSGEAAESMMSYAELQAQLAALCGEKKK